MHAKMEDALSEKLHSNYVPSLEEVLQIDEYLEDPSKRISQVDQTITRLQAEIDLLSRERTQILDKIGPYKALISPMRRLPGEILQEIFVRCLPTHHNALMDSTEAPLLLGRICSGWRKASRSNPLLWASVHISPVFELSCAGVDDKWATLQIAIKEWLERAGHCPLAISLKEHSDGPSPAVMKTVTLFSKRWKHINFVLVDLPTSPVTKLSSHDVPILESISIVDASFTDPPHENWTSYDIFKAPFLREVRVLHPQYHYRPDQLRWEQLTHLHVHNITGYTTGFLEILGVARNLIDCSLHVGPCQTLADLPAPIHLLSLTKFSLTGSPNLLKLLQYLDLPRLRSFNFCVRSHYEPGQNISHALPTFLSRITALTHLTVDPRCMSRELLLKCLHETPRVTHLTIRKTDRTAWARADDEHYSLTDSIILRFFLPNTYALQSSLCPLLEYFYCDHHDLSDKVILAFIEARQDHLRFIEIHFRRGEEVNLAPEIAPFVKSGMEVSLLYAEKRPPTPWAQENRWKEA
ncbi:hypothetical protein FPV67DRAFT_929860 [Lyophyllum atratum]|nr:hypothetical protein FPV67DRAFT_929860 [Lyophyllum atratum]